MDNTLLVNLVWFVALAVLGLIAQFIAAYLKAKGRITEEAAHQIAIAEEAFATVEKAGERKMQLCIDALYGMVPSQVKLFISREMIGEIVQRVFDNVEKYKDAWVEKAAQDLAGKIPEIAEEVEAE